MSIFSLSRTKITNSLPFKNYYLLNNKNIVEFIPSHASFVGPCNRDHGWMQLSSTVPKSRFNPKLDVINLKPQTTKNIRKNQRVGIIYYRVLDAMLVAVIIITNSRYRIHFVALQQIKESKLFFEVTGSRLQLGNCYIIFNFKFLNLETNYHSKINPLSSKIAIQILSPGV